MLAREHDGPGGVEVHGAGDLGLGLGEDFLFDGLAAAVVLLDDGGEVEGLFLVLAAEQLDAGVGVAEAAHGVETRGEAVGDVVAGDLLVDVADGLEFLEADALAAAQLPEAVLDEDAVRFILAKSSEKANKPTDSNCFF